MYMRSDTSQSDNLFIPYTHGLEKTYAIQHLDLSTIRPLQIGKAEELKLCQVEAQSLEKISKNLQRHLPFGEYFEEAISPFTINNTKETTDVIDPEAWFRSLFGDLPQKITRPLLEEYGLKIDLADSASPEIFRMCGENTRKALFIRQWRQVCDAFLMPWMRRRGGIASEEELLERLENVSQREILIRPLMTLFQRMFSPQQPLLTGQLILIDPEIYADTSLTKLRYQQIQKQVKTYFYQNGIVYELEHLIALLHREQAQKGLEFDEVLFRRLVILDGAYYLEKRVSGQVIRKVN